MAKEYFLAHNELGYWLFDSKPHLERQVTRPCHWEWRDSKLGRGLALMGGGGNYGMPFFRDVQINSYIKLIDFGEDGLFSPLRKCRQDV
jgi:hypothetical protein